MVACGKMRLDSAFREDMFEESKCRAIQLWRGNDIVPCFQKINERILDRCHPGTYAEGLDPSFERSHAFFEHRICWIPDARVDIPRDLQIEEGCAMLGAVEFKGHRLINGHGDRFGVWVAVVPYMNCDGFFFHDSTCTDLTVNSFGGGHLRRCHACCFFDGNFYKPAGNRVSSKSRAVRETHQRTKTVCCRHAGKVKAGF